jgi:hypothetical protein
MHLLQHRWAIGAVGNFSDSVLEFAAHYDGPPRGGQLARQAPLWPLPGVEDVAPVIAGFRADRDATGRRRASSHAGQGSDPAAVGFHR